MHRFIPLLYVVTSFLAAAGSKTASLPLYFEPNQGQADPRVEFLARGSGLTSYLTSREALLSVHGTPVRMHLVGASARKPEGVDRLPGTSSYFRGKDSSKWRTAIPQFGKVRYRDVYPGINVVYYGTNGNLEYDFQIAPGADPRKISMAYDGAQGLKIEANGDLILTTTTGEIRQRRPVVYQEHDGLRSEIAAAYKLTGNRTVALTLADYDWTKPLIVDPMLQYASFFGGPGGDGGHGIKVDAAGNLYIFATLALPQSDSNPFSSTATGSGQEVAIIKFSPAQNAILFVAHVGSTGMNYLDGSTIDASGAMYLSGRTTTNDIPLVNPILSQGTTSTAFFAMSAFITKIAADGKSIVFSTYFAGTAGQDEISSLATDANGNVYMAGLANSGDFPVLKALYQPGAPNQAFLAEVSPSGTLIFSTVYPMIWATCVSLDGNSGVYIAGEAEPSVFPPINSIQPKGPFEDPKAAAVKFSSDGQTVIYSTMFGGDDLGPAQQGGSQVQACAADSLGNLYVTGSTESPGFPLVNAVQNHPGAGEDGFLSGISPQGNTLTFSTLLGGNRDDWPYSVALDAAGRIYVAGQTYSTDFPVLNSAPTSLPKTAGNTGLSYGFVTAYAPGGQSLLYSTLVGGSVQDIAWGIATDSKSNVYVAGQTESPDFPVTKGAYQATYGGNWDAFLLILAPDASITIPATPQVVTFVATVDSPSPASQTVALTAPAGATISTSATTASGGNWLTASLSGTTLSVSANSAGLASADYNGTIQVTAGSATLNIAVILHVTPPPAVLVSYSPDPWPLTSPTGPFQAAPLLTVTGTGFVNGASAHVYSSGSGQSSSRAIDANQVTVVNSTTVQFYTSIGSSTPLTVAVTVTNPYSAESNPLTIQVGAPSPQISAVQNAASGTQGGKSQPVSPGEIITITGLDFGPPFGISAPSSYTSPIMQLGDTQVLFDGVAAPITYVSGSQINAVVPYSLSAKTTTNLTVKYLGVASAPTALNIVPSMAGLFTASAAGSGQASILNQDGSTNSSSNPAALSSTVTLYATGMGTTNPQIADNTVPQANTVQPALPVSVTIDSLPATVTSSYAAPGMLGVLVINAQVPSSAHVGPAIPVVVQVGTSQSQQGVTIAIH
jgi:uncharacterized protein (TIGR03437 family)